MSHSFPGRCPGLTQRAPLGLKTIYSQHLSSPFPWRTACAVGFEDSRLDHSSFSSCRSRFIRSSREVVEAPSSSARGASRSGCVGRSVVVRLSGFRRVADVGDEGRETAAGMSPRRDSNSVSTACLRSNNAPMTAVEGPGLRPNPSQRLITNQSN